MLTPHHRKDSELGKIRFAAENFLDPLEFFRGETVFRHQLRSNDRIGGRFSAGHRQRTLTEAERDSTRLRTQLTDNPSPWDGAPDRARSSARFPLLFVRGEGKGEESENGDFLRMNSNTG